MATEDIVNGSQPDPSSSAGTATATASVPAEKKWPGWPGDCVFRVVIPVAKVGCIIGKKGELIKKMCEDTRARIRVLDGALGTNDRIVKEVPHYATSDERIVEIQGEASKVLKALEAIVGHLRKFLVDHSVIPLFEKTGSAPTTQDRVTDTWVEKPQTLLHPVSQPGIGNDYPFSLKRESLYLDREPQLESHTSLSLYGQDPALVGLRPPGPTRSAATIVTQVTQTMQIPLSYAEDIIGIGGANIAYIRRTSGAILTVQESRGLPDEITVEIKGTSLQVQTAQQLIHEFIAGHKEPSVSSYVNMDTGLRYGSHQMAGNSSYQPSLPAQPLGGYGSSGLGGYSNFRL
ncbi:hypothetical protein MKW94_017782 [Papaver nudicaule]|uniref:K Homology domain-containing protein n=1 Tax=Papaver nudicaule TaxID=74823 RepID=A0AA42B0W1_PAPNU|nr:hypothetical protein [Papaver nudicaule]